MMMVRASQADARQEAILTATAHLIEKGGPDSVSMRAIADETGLSRPAIYQYFASREHIFAELVINEMADLSNELDEKAQKTDDPVIQLTIWVRHTLFVYAAVVASAARIAEGGDFETEAATLERFVISGVIGA